MRRKLEKSIEGHKKFLNKWIDILCSFKEVCSPPK
jgi:hypothetical protein